MFGRSNLEPIEPVLQHYVITKTGKTLNWPTKTHTAHIGSDYIEVHSIEEGRMVAKIYEPQAWYKAFPPRLYV